MPVQESERVCSVSLLAGLRVMLSGGEEAMDPNDAGWFENSNYLEDDILPASGKGKSSTLA